MVRLRSLVFLMVTCISGMIAVGPTAAIDSVELPLNVALGSFQPVVETMWRRSPTFRRQCARLSAAGQLSVVLLPEDAARHPSFFARTVMTNDNGALRSAHVYITRFHNPVELIAHEFEHVLEQLDGIDLSAHLSTGNVSRREDGALETLRATEVGRRVAREVDPGLLQDEPQPAAGQMFTAASAVAVLRDQFAAPADERAAQISGNGRYVVFAGAAPLLPSDRNRRRDIYVTDLQTGQLTHETPGTEDGSSNGESINPAVSDDGRYLAFESTAGNLIGESRLAGLPRVFLRDRLTGTTRLLSSGGHGDSADGASYNAAISGDSSAVVFGSSATNLLDRRIVGNSQGIYLFRVSSDERLRIDVTSAGQVRAGQSTSPAITADGRFVVFGSKADLTCGTMPDCLNEPADVNGMSDIYLRDTVLLTTRRISRTPSGHDPDGPSYDAAISRDGRYVAFVSQASNLIRNGGQRGSQVYLHDTSTGATSLVSHSPGGDQANNASRRPALSGDGGLIAFQSLASNLSCETSCRAGDRDFNLLWDVFICVRATHRIIRASADNGPAWLENSRGPSIDATGNVLIFTSRHPADDRDNRHDDDVYRCVALQGR
jgi:Tol biopolymer transport system component